MNLARRDVCRARLQRLTGAAVVALVTLGLQSAADAAEQTIIKSLAIQPYYFSPAGGDSVTFRYEVNDTATVYLIVFENDSATVVDTLVAGVSRLSGIQHKAAWHGVRFDGTPAPEDTFLAVLRAETGTETQSLYSPLFFIDETSPQVFITLVDPGVIAPGSTDPAQSPDAEITCAVSDPPPADSLEVDVVVYGPEGTRVETLPERLVPANGTFKSVWNGEGATDDGFHRIEVTVRDRASNSASAESFVDVDTEGPTISISSLGNDSTMRVLPDSLFGWAWDRSGGRDTVWVEYPTRSVFLRIPSSYTRLDTLFFGIVLGDSISQEGTHSLRFKAFDKLGQERIRGFDVTWDNTAPPAPVLDEPPAVTHSPNLLLAGTVGGNAGDVMRIYRNDAPPDTIFPNVEGQWPHVLALEPGPNRISAVMADETGNVSEPSNTIEVTFDPTKGLYVPQPFRAGDAFQVNLAEPARAVTLRLYDLGGHLVRLLEERSPADKVSIAWNGLNGDGQKVKKGPLVAVAVVELSSGKNEVFREIFLFEL